MGEAEIQSCQLKVGQSAPRRAANPSINQTHLWLLSQSPRKAVMTWVTCLTPEGSADCVPNAR